MNTYGADRSWPFAQGGSTTIFIFSGLLGAAVVLLLLFPNSITAVFLVLVFPLWLLILYFFRDPNRDIISEPGLVVSPGDGRIVEIVREREERYLKAESVRISIFLSVTDVHVQRIPLNGEVTLVEHQPGKFLQAFRPEASDVNEYVAMVIDSGFGRVLIKQIAGILARRCVNYSKVNDQVSTGQRFGLIRFGSRVDLFLPAEAELLAKVGDKALGGLTPIARLTWNGTQ
jgi:phosphatidylserine decarboxylase